jgi:glycosyltransferase involved in cell wall biosynthesis
MKNSPERPSVAVVIPTTGRSTLQRAVASALAQSFPPSEVIIVADTERPIEEFLDQRVKIVRVGPGAGGNTARQRGIEVSASDLIALLDDDDTWHSDKLRDQVEASLTRPKTDHSWIVTCLLTPITSGGEYLPVIPARLLSASETLPNYLFRKEGIRSPQGFIQSSTLLFPRSLALTVPFDEELRFHQDIGWLVDVATRFPDVAVVQVQSSLVGFHLSDSSLISRIPIRGSATWARQRLSRFGRPLVADFILTQTLELARRRRFPLLPSLQVIWLSFMYGRPPLASFIRALSIVGSNLPRELGRLQMRVESPIGRR